MKYELKQLNINMGESEYEMPQAENFVITMVKEAKDAIISSAELCEKMLIHNQVSQWRESGLIKMRLEVMVFHYKM